MKIHYTGRSVLLSLIKGLCTPMPT